jgi:hypothetical protein
MRPLLPVLLLAACSETGILQNYEVPELAFAWDEPLYGAFVGDVAVVRGHATPGAVVVVEGAQVPLGDDGSFSVPIPVDRPYRILEVSADLYGQHAEDRRPVFGGTDPRLSWPGGISARLTDHALDGVASLLAAAGEGILAEDALKGLIPPVDLAGTTIAIDSVTRSPVGVTLVPSEAGVTARFEVYDLTFNILGAQVFQAPLHRPSFETLTPSQASALPFSPALNPAGPALSDAHVHQAHLTAEPWALPSQPCPHRPLPSPAPRHDPTSRVRRPVPRRGPDQQYRRVLLQPDQHVTSARPHDRPLAHPRVALRAPQRIMAERPDHELVPWNPGPSPNTDRPRPHHHLAT